MTLTINDLTDGDSPKVEVLLTGLSGSVATVTAYRLCGGVEHRVSGVIDAPVSGAGSWVDYEVPAQSATYRAEMFDSGGVSLGFTENATVELGYTGCWMHSALAPTTAVQVELLDTAARKLSRPVPSETVRPKGRRVGVIVSEPRYGLTGPVFDVIAHDFQTADKIQAFLGSEPAPTVPVVCIRFGVDIPAGRRIVSPLFLGVHDIVEEPFDAYDADDLEATVQRIQGDEAARPAPGVFIPLLRRSDLNAYYATRTALNSAYLTRLAAARDYALAGFAG